MVCIAIDNFLASEGELDSRSSCGCWLFVFLNPRYVGFDPIEKRSGDLRPVIGLII